MSITQKALQTKKARQKTVKKIKNSQKNKKQSKEKIKNNKRKVKKKIKEGERNMKKEKKIALITLLVMILNMFSPYSILFNNISKAATGVLGENPIIINNLGVTKKGSNKILTVEITLCHYHS